MVGCQSRKLHRAHQTRHRNYGEINVLERILKRHKLCPPNQATQLTSAATKQTYSENAKRIPTRLFMAEYQFHDNVDTRSQHIHFHITKRDYASTFNTFCI